VALHHELLVVVTGAAGVTETEGADGAAATEPPETGAEGDELGAAASTTAFSCSRRAIARFRRASCLL
jgi:hypothetical protein